jgi:hypothetical protein
MGAPSATDTGDTMSWQDLEAASPRIAARGRELVMRGGTGRGMLASVTATGLPRLHPVSVVILDGRLLVFSIDASPRTRAFLEDGRYAFHAHVDLAHPDELLLRGHAIAVTDATLRQRALEVWPFEASEGYTLFELSIEHALLGERETAHDWPPRYTTWRAPAPATATTSR